jgi:hypothetical protein
LALFGRRPHQRVNSLVMPATQNLHKSRHFSQKHYKLVAAISCLYRGARCGPERAEHATITRFGFQPLATALAVVKVQASEGICSVARCPHFGQVIVEISINGVPRDTAPPPIATVR